MDAMLSGAIYYHTAKEGAYAPWKPPSSLDNLGIRPLLFRFCLYQMA